MYSRLAQRTLSATAAVNRIKEWVLEIFCKSHEKGLGRIYRKMVALTAKNHVPNELNVPC